MTRPARRYGRPLDILEVTPETVTERLSYRLQQMVGTGRPWSYRVVSTRTHIDIRTLKAYVQGTACPNLVKYKRLLALLGPQIGTELNVMKGWLPRSDMVPPEAVNLIELRNELTRANAIIGQVLDQSDGDTAPDSGSKNPPSGMARTVHHDEAHQDELVEQANFGRPLRVDEIDVRAVALRLSYRLRMLIGPGRDWQIEDVSSTTGIDRRTLQSYLDGSACPNLARYLRLTYLMGPSVGVELARMIGWEPRYSAEALADRVDVAALYDSIAAVRTAVERVIERRAAVHAGYLIRLGDRVVGEDPPGDQEQSVIPLSVHR